MIDTDQRLPRVRECRSWSCEVKYGPTGLDDTVNLKEDEKEVPMLEPYGRIGNMLVSAERRYNVGVQMRFTVRAWVSTPVVAELNEDLREKGLHLSRVLRRLIRMRASKFFKGLNNGA